MPEETRRIRIFLSSPGDVAAERKIAREVLESLNADPFIKPHAVIEPVAWEAPGSRVLMPASLTPQQAIDRKLAKPSETDAVIVILWGRMGTPLDVEKHGLKADGTPFQSGTEWEYLDAIAGAKAHPQNLPIVLVYRRTDTPPYPADDDLDALAEWVEQRKRVQTFFADFRGTGGEYRQSYIEYTSPDDFREQFTQDARLLAKELLALRTTAPPAPQGDEEIRIEWPGSPFPGLRAFDEKDEPIFFGRGLETADLIKRISQQRLMFVVGASGSGKSSLVGAGVVPKLKRGAVYGVNDWHVVRFTPGDHPFKRLALALLRTLPALKDPIADDEERAVQLAGILRKSPEKLAVQIEKWLDDEPDGIEILLFIDQFEELFTTTSTADIMPFAEMLKQLSPQVRVIATMRSDFYDRALKYFETTLRDGSFTLDTPSAMALYEMITRPAAVTGLRFDEGLAETIVQKTTGQKGGLALLAYLLEAMYQQTAQRGDQRLTHADYDELGGVDRAIATRAQAIYTGLDLPDDRKRTAMQRVFHELVEPTVRDGEVVATRRRAEQALFAGDADAIAFIEAFQKARLLVSDQGMIEVAHEALLREWDDLAGWITRIGDDLRLLRQYERDADDWQRRGGDPDDQPRAEQLRFFYASLDNLDIAYTVLPEPLKTYVEPEQNRLLRVIEDIETPHERRRDIGDRLAVIGDTRPGVGVKILPYPSEAVGRGAGGEGLLPDIDWLFVEGSDGPVTFKDEDDEVYGEFEVKPFYIARYQVTYAQYRIFAEDDYDNPAWWEGFPDRYRLRELRAQRTKIDNAPRDSISWYQSVAFARWLDARLRAASLLPDASLQVRLPTEWEWQWAAQGGLQMEYPWGEGDGHRCNTSEAGLSRTTSVGMYPDGASACGGLDMAGNL